MGKADKLLIRLLLMFFVIYIPFPSFAGQTWLTWNERSGLPGNNFSCLAVAPSQPEDGYKKPKMPG
jgi:hypothetical protein